MNPQGFERDQAYHPDRSRVAILNGSQRTLTPLTTCPRTSTKIKSFSEMDRTAKGACWLTRSRCTDAVHRKISCPLFRTQVPDETGARTNTC